ncbi:MAG: hypothetical protein MI810_16285, partial [Flavobacteriales bacterium]|nr:hypothetical protein [Flavobacteriales bacterium]
MYTIKTYPPLPSLKKDSQGLPIKGHVNQRWLSSGRTIQNNKGKAIKQYEPFHSSTWRYEAEKEVTDTGISPTMHYDVLGRLIKTDTTKGFMSKVKLSAWEQKSYDANDCVLESDYYKKNHNSLQSGELDALKKAIQHANTPAKSILDNLGRAIENIAVDENGKKYITSVQLDFENKQLSITDARQFELNKRPSTKQIRNFNYTYDMQGNLLKTDSMDAGIDIAFTDSIGKSLFSWDSRGYNGTIDYDELHRPTSKHIKGNSLNQTVERLFYGDSTINSRKYNRIGKLIKHYHQAGIDITESCDFKGKPLSTQQQLRAEYKKEVKWNDLNSEKLLPKIYENKLETNVIGKPIWQELADGSIHYPIFTKSGKLKKVAVSYPENPTKRETIVEDIIYNEKGQRKKIEYANGVITNYKYDPKTYDLTHLKTKRKSDNKVLQDITYYYDPAGNITRIEDASHQKVFYDQQQVSPICDYTYDALYQLKEATGREHPALQKNSHKKGFKQSAFIKLNDQQKLRNYTEKYSYDEAGNLTEQKHLANQNNWTRKIEVDQNSNRAVLKDDLNGNSMDSFFDPNGNLIKLDHLRKINWNFRDNIQSVILVERANGKHDAEYYVYDEDGNRVRKIKEIYSNNGATLTIDEKIYLGGVEIKKIRKISNSIEKLELERISTHLSDDSSRIAISHYWKVDTKNREVDQPKVRKTHYQLNNHLGSASMELSAKGEIISYEEYMPYGGTAFSAGKNQKEVALKDYRYSGKERDDSTGRYYYGQRYYVPWMCRWLNP